MRATAWTLLAIFLVSLAIVPTSTARTCVEGTVSVCVGSYRVDECRNSGVTASVPGVSAEAGGYDCGTPEGVAATASTADMGTLVEMDWSQGSGACRFYVGSNGVYESLSGVPCPEQAVRVLGLLS